MNHKPYIRITRNDVNGSYIQPLDEIHNAIDGELDTVDYLDSGIRITLEIVFMTDDEYSKLPEFEGW